MKNKLKYIKKQSNKYHNVKYIELIDELSR